MKIYLFLNIIVEFKLFGKNQKKIFFFIFILTGLCLEFCQIIQVSDRFFFFISRASSFTNFYKELAMFSLRNNLTTTSVSRILN